MICNICTAYGVSKFHFLVLCAFLRISSADFYSPHNNLSRGAERSAHFKPSRAFVNALTYGVLIYGVRSNGQCLARDAQDWKAFAMQPTSIYTTPFCLPSRPGEWVAHSDALGKRDWLESLDCR